MSATTTTPRLLTEADLLAMPDDGVERWLIRGQLWEKPSREKAMTVRNRFHSRILANLLFLLKGWLGGQPVPRGQVLGGEAGIRLGEAPDTVVGVDAAYVSAETVACQTDETTLIAGVPILAAEILSPSDTHEAVHKKIDVYLQSGVALVWIVDPHDQTVLVYRAGKPPQLFAIGQDLTAEPQLPGFCVPVARIFE
jgi:Uma2 family endonuclease